MRLTHFVPVFLLGKSLVEASVLPENKQQHAERNDDVDIDVDVEVVLSSATTIFELAKELAIEDISCLLAANPSVIWIQAGECVTVPQHCCGPCCEGPFCSNRGRCHGQSTSTAPVQTGTSTSCTTITTSVPSSHSSSKPTQSSSTSGQGSSSSVSTSSLRSSTGSTSSTRLTSSTGLTSTSVYSTSQGSSTAPTSSGTSRSSSSLTTGSASTSGLNTTVSSSGTSVSSSTVGPPGTGSSSSSVNPNSSTTSKITSSGSPPVSSSTTIPGLVTTTNSAGQTVISDSSGAVTLPTGISTSSLVTLPDGSVITFQPSTPTPSTSSTSISGLVTTTNSAGQTVISDSSGAVTLPTGISTSSLVTLPDGSVITFQPSTPSRSSTSTSISGLVTTTNSAGQTVISDSSGAVTLPTGISTSSLVTLPDGSVITFQPSTASQSSSSTSIPGLVTTTNSAGQTVISDSSGAVTLPTGISTSSLVTLPDGSVITFQPSRLSSSLSSTAGIITTTNSAGLTVISESGEGFTIPTGLTQATTITGSDGVVVTFSPGSPTSPTTSSTPATSSTSSSSSVIPGGFLFPITTSVPAPKATDGGTAIPCNLWFFFICLRWGDLDIQGWEFNLPPGTYPPGPPPPITIDPRLSITLSISGTLPDWPSLTIGPDHLPTYEPKPSNGPDDGCETESAELCATSTSYGVSQSGASTITTGSEIVSTCATIYGCDVEGSSSSTATTSTATCSGTGCACATWAYDSGIDWNAYGNQDPDAPTPLPVARKVKRDPIETATTLSTETSGTRTIPETTPDTTAPPFDHAALLKRTQTDMRSSAQFGTCVLNTAATFSPYPDVSDFPNFPAASSYFVISQRSNDAGTCYAGYIYSTNNLAQASRAAGGPTYATTPAPNPTPVVNTDHVFENSLLGTFFAYALGLPGAPTCEEFNTNLANINHPEFAALDRFVNQAKANYFAAAGGVPNVAANAYANAINQLQTFGIVADVLGFQQFVSLFRTTHQRLYQVFGIIDQGFAGCNQAGVSDTWAATYSQFMTLHLSSRASVWTSAATSWYDILSNGQAAGAAVPVYTQLATTYPANAFSIPVSEMAIGLQPAPAPPGKRQNACTLDPLSSGSSISSGSTGSTTRSSSSTSSVPPPTSTSSTPPTSTSSTPPPTSTSSTLPPTSSSSTLPPTSTSSPPITSTSTGPPSFISCSTQNEDPDQGITSPYCVCSGSTLSESVNTAVTPANSCAYTALPSSTVSAPIQTITTTETGICSVCTFVGQSETCTSLASCTPTPTTTPAPPITSGEPAGALYFGWYTTLSGAGGTAGFSSQWNFLDYQVSVTTDTLYCSYFASNTVAGAFHTTSLNGAPPYPGPTVTFPSAVQGHSGCVWVEPSAPGAATGTLKCADTTVACGPIASPTSTVCYDAGLGAAGLNLYQLADCYFP